MTYDDLTSAHHRLPEGDGSDDWLVISIVDARGTGADLAFTDGLYRFGQPELVLWARPTEGSDPGADWLLTHDDRITALDCWACDLVDGALAPGDTAVRGFDDGHTTASFRFSTPRPAGEAGVAGLPADRPVIVAEWSLTRRTPPAPVDPAAPAVRRVHRWTTRAQSITDLWSRTADAGRVMPLSPSPTRFGPMTDWVQARIEQVLAAGEPVLAEFFGRLPVTAVVRCEHCVHDDLERLACTRGRGGAAREARNAAELLTMALTEEPASVAWRTVFQDLSGALPPMPPNRVEEMMQERLTGSLESLLLAAVVGDLAPSALMSSASGAWEWAVQAGRVPGRAWLAPPTARRQVQQLVTGPDGACLLLPALGLACPARWPERTTAMIAGLQTTAAGSARPGWLLTSRQARPLSRAQVRQLEALAAPLLTAVALPGRVDPQVWQSVTTPLRPFLPALPMDPPGGNRLDLGCP
jgi:hypothetical protein